MTIIGVHLAGCAVLVVAGVAKLLRPDELAVALARRLHASRTVATSSVRVLAATEVVLGCAGVARPGGVAAGFVALSYVAFTAYVWSLRRAGAAVSSCGCFGEPDTPATRAHVAVTTMFAVASAVVALRGRGGLTTVLAAQPGAGVPLLLAASVVAMLAVLVLTRHAEVQAVRALYAGGAG
ncbi:MAG: hypothetical protein V7636_1216 [Actinomycetota bacterium]